MKLGAVAEFNMGQAPHSSTYNRDGKGVLLIKAGDFKELFPTPMEYTTAPISFSKDGDVLICVVGATSGKVNLGIDASITRSIAAIRPDAEKLDGKFLFLFLKNQYRRLNKLATGSAQGIISKPVLFNIELPNISRDDQLRIANILSKAESLISQRKEGLRLLDELLKSTFLEMFRDPFVGKNVRPLGMHLKLQQGYAFKSGDFIDEGIPVIKIGTINKGYFDVNLLSFLGKDFESGYESYTIRPGDLLISLTGTVGKDDYANTCLVPSTFAFYLLNQRVAKLIPDGRALLKPYIDFLFKYPDFKRKLVKNNRGVRQANLSSNDIYTIEVNVPEISLQTQFAQIVEKTEALKAHYQASLHDLENLYGALSQRAFRGELGNSPKRY